MPSKHERLTDTRVEEMKRLIQKSLAASEPAPHVSPEEVLKLVHEVQELRAVCDPVFALLRNGDDASSVTLCAPLPDETACVFVVNKATNWTEQRVPGSSMSDALLNAREMFGK